MAPITFESSSDDCTSCQNRIEQLETQISFYETEGKKIKAKYFDMLVENLRKDIQIDELKEKVRLCKTYRQHEQDFSADSMKKLRSFGFTHKEDSSFILSAIRGLYDGQMEVLSKRTVSGRSKDDSKMPVTPKKMNILSKLLDERIEMNPELAIERKQNFSKIVRFAIDAVNKKK